ncbi:type II secretion system F family protein [Ramlibacter sp. MAHUQ-53]|uniref:type II secretion system F family protein n=1 Tax=unclassified Ramlibacter TaxID=2617605 RepID=UPI00363A8779
MQFVVRALDASQQVGELRLEALDAADACAQARARGLTPLSVRARRLSGRGPRFALLLFAQELLALLEAGLAVVEAIDALVEKEPAGHRRAILERLGGHLREGWGLSQALRRQGAVFPSLFCGLVASAEGTSDLPQALARYVAYESRLTTLRDKVVSAAVYPAILLAVGACVGLFLLAYVVPRFAAVYAGAGRELPWASQLLMDWGRFAGRHALALGGGLALALAAAALALLRLRRHGGWWRLLAALPGARGRLATLELARLCLTLGLLVEGGIPVVSALQLGADAVGPATRERLRAVQGEVLAGQPLSQALAHQGLGSPVALRLLRVGERSGRLGDMLSRAAAFHDGEATRWIERFARAFEPALMAAIGLVIGLIVVLLYMPVFELAGSLQ